MLVVLEFSVCMWPKSYSRVVQIGAYSWPEISYFHFLLAFPTLPPFFFYSYFCFLLVLQRGGLAAYDRLSLHVLRWSWFCPCTCALDLLCLMPGVMQPTSTNRTFPTFVSYFHFLLWLPTFISYFHSLLSLPTFITYLHLLHHAAGGWSYTYTCIVLHTTCYPWPETP